MHLVYVLFGEDALNKIIYQIYVDKTRSSGKLACALFDNYTYSAQYKIIKLPFEGRMLNSLDSYDEILRKEYGNYMELPPADKRYPQHIEEYILKVDCWD